MMARSLPTLILLCWGGCMAQGAGPSASPPPITNTIEIDAHAPTAPLNLTTAKHRTGEYHFQFPAHPIGVIWFFHGHGKERAGGFLWRTEARRLLTEALGRGYAIILPDSTAQGEWTGPTSLTIDSPDRALIRQIRTELQQLGLITAGMAEFGFGISNGGKFLSYLGWREGFRASACYASKGNPMAFKLAEGGPPVFFAIGHNDPHVTPSEVTQVSATLSAKGIPTQVYVKPTEAVDEELFRRIDGLSEDDRRELVSVLKSEGLLDSHNHLRTPPHGGLVATLPARFQSRERQKQIEELLSVAWAGHTLSRDSFDEMFDFFNTHRGQ